MMDRLAFTGPWFVALALFMGCEADLPGTPLTPEERLDPNACRQCHPGHVAEWEGSMHALSTRDPIFRAMNQRGQRETDGALGSFCVECHAPVAVRLGLTEDGLNLDEIPEHLQSVTCAFCHQVTGVNALVNNGLEWTDDGIMRGGISAPQKTAAHGSAYSTLHDRGHLSSAAMCGSCHDVLTPSGFALERTYVEWEDTLFNSDDPLEANTCNDCHMPGRRGAIATGGPIRRRHSHGMPAIDIPLDGDPLTELMRGQVQRELDTSLAAELCVIPRRGGAEVEVYLENLSAGHLFPSGASHDRRVWVELIGYSGSEQVFESGLVGDGQTVAELDPEEVWMLHDRAFKADGSPAHMFWDVARVEPGGLPAPNLLFPGSPGYVDPHVGRRYIAIGEDIDRFSMRVRLRPIGYDVIDDLIETGDLEPSIRDTIPTYELASTVLTWREADAVLKITSLAGREALCVPAPR